MNRPRLPAAALHDSPDEVEAQFYEALQQGDIVRMLAVWTDDDDTVWFSKWTWNGTSSWSPGTQRNMGSIQASGAGSNLLSAAFDGTRYCMAWVNNASSSAIDGVLTTSFWNASVGLPKRSGRISQACIFSGTSPSGGLSPSA